MGQYDLRITDYTTGVWLTGGAGADGIDTKIDGYVPQSPQPISELLPSTKDGGEVSNVRYPNLAEVAECVVASGTPTATIQTIERLFRQAAARQKRRNVDKVYVELEIDDGSGDAYRSEILSGRHNLSPQALGLQWLAQKIDAMFGWERRYYWEYAPNVIEIPLANGSGSGTGGRAIYNHDDGDANHDNYVEISGSDIDGVLPAPLYLVLTSTYGSGQTFKVYAGSLYDYSASFAHILEGESAWAVGGVTQGDTNSSGGFYESCTWAGSSETLAYRWDLTSAFLGACAGRDFRILARFPSAEPPTDTTIQMKVGWPSGGTPSIILYEAAAMVASANELQDLGIVRLPPWLWEFSSYQTLSLCLYVTKSGGGTFGLDFAQVTPLDAGYRTFTPLGSTGLTNGEDLYDHGIDERTYVEDTSSLRSGHYLDEGERIHVWPGIDQRIYILVSDGASGQTMDIARTHSVRAFYRPRRLDL